MSRSDILIVLRLYSGKGTSEIGVMSGEKSLWLDYLPRFVVCAAGSARFVAVSTEDGALNVYSPTGRRCAFLRS